MKLISLNTWGGKLHKPLLQFVGDQSLSTDIFCFQEVFDSPVTQFRSDMKTDLYSDLKKTLKNFKAFYAPMFTGYDTEVKVDFPLSFGQATFVKKDVGIVNEETVFIHGKFDYKPEVFLEGIEDALDLPRNMQIVKIKLGKKEILIGNLHGYWRPGPKVDSQQSIDQSKRIIKTLNKFDGPKIICGDFNLNLSTKSLAILEKSLENLVRKFKIPTTRSHHYKKTSEKFADYMFASKEVKVKSFSVPTVVVSDHLPLILEFSA
ncbi:MAG: endonuclease/exonuclease/phosphatase family protein [Patescibacteria group bacterium]